jgi:hypothetical protein
MPQPQPDENGRPPRPPKIVARGLEDDFPVDGSIIDNIERRMRFRFPNAFTDRGKDHVAFLPDRPDGFSVRLTVKSKRDGIERFTINYGPIWAVTCSPHKAIEAFAFGLSTDRRIREYRGSGLPYYWVVDLWDYHSKVWTWGRCFVLWRRMLSLSKPRMRILQNHLIDFEEDAASYAA